MTWFSRTITITILLAMAFSVNSFAIWAQTTPEKTLRMPYAEFYPFTFTNPEGAAEGYNIELMEDLAGRIGYQMEFIPARNPTEFLRMLEAGEVDVTPLLALTPKRLENGLATQPLGAFTVSIFLRANHSAETLTALSGLRVAAVKGSISERQARTIPFADLVLFDSPDQLIMPLLSGQVDAVASVTDVFLERLRSGDVDEKVRALDETLLSVPYGILIHPDLVQLRADLDSAVDTLLASGALPALHERWFGREKTIFDSTLFWWISAELIAVCIILCAMWRRVRKLRNNSKQLDLENRANRLLIEALDGLETAIVIYDKDMRALHWNEGVREHLPDIIAELKVGATLPEVAEANVLRMAAQGEKCFSELRSQTQALWSTLRAGERIQYTQKSDNGLVLDVRHFPLGKNHFATTYINITKLHEQRETIAAQAKELEERNSQLLNFAAIAAHDLRAPLVQQKTLMGFITEDIASAEVALPEDVHENFEMMELLSTRMSNLIRDLLDYAKVGSVSENTKVIEPSQILTQVIDLVGTNPGFEINIQANMPPLCVDPTAFETVMRNLVSNAIKHHDCSNGRIQIGAEQLNNGVQIDVEDDGPGIPHEFRKRIFEPFKRLSSHVDGSGLGLSMIDKTVKAWGGTIDVLSAEPKGSVFRIFIPQKHVQLAGNLDNVVVLKGLDRLTQTAPNRARPKLSQL